MNSYIPVLHRLALHAETNNLRAFTLLPLSSYHTKFAEFDSWAFLQLLQGIRARNPAIVPPLPSWQHFNNIIENDNLVEYVLPPPGTYHNPPQNPARVADHWWYWMFRLECTTTESRRFGCYISTDGVSARVAVERPRHNIIPRHVDGVFFMRITSS